MSKEKKIEIQHRKPNKQNDIMHLSISDKLENYQNYQVKVTLCYSSMPVQKYPALPKSRKMVTFQIELIVMLMDTVSLQYFVCIKGVTSSFEVTVTRTASIKHLGALFVVVTRTGQDSVKSLIEFNNIYILEAHFFLRLSEM